MAASDELPSPNADEGAPEPARPAAITAILWLLGGLLILAAGFTIWAAQALFIPLVLALLISYALQPAHRFLVRIEVPATLAAAVIVLAAIGITASAAYALRPEVTSFARSLPDAAAKIRSRLEQPPNKAPTAVAEVQRAARELERASVDGGPSAAPAPGVTRVQVEAAPFSVSRVLWSTTGGAIAVIGQTLVVIVLVFYFLAAGDMYKRKVVRIAGTTLSEKRVTVEILNDIERHLARYLAARLVVSALVGTATALSFWGLGMPQPAVWGFVAGLLNVVPYVGPIVFSLAAWLAAFLHSDSLAHALIVATAASVIATIEGFFVTPVLMGRAGRMNGASVFIALTIWGFLWGLWGMLLAVPLTMTIKVICEHIDGLRPVSELLSEEA